MIKFSIIIPVYNVKSYLTRCVDSIIHQNYPKDQMQVLLVDDGSTDGSGEMCDSIAAEYGFIEVYHKENGGLSDARNYGLARATGEYVIFLDSDDYLNTTACSDFAVAITAQTILPDVVTGATVKHIGNNKISIPRVTANMSLLTGEEFLTKELQCGKFFVAAWASIYKKSFLSDHQFLFRKGMLHEDEDFTPRVLLKADAILSTDIVFYHYIIREDSITTQKDRTRNAVCIFDICRGLTPVFDEIQNPELKALLKSHLAKIMFKIVCDAELYRPEKRHLIDYKLLKQNSVFLSEKGRYVILRLSPKLLYRITNLRRS